LIFEGNPVGRMRWVQRVLPTLGAELDVACIHLTTMEAPFFSRLPILISPAGFGADDPPSGFRARLGKSIGSGGAARASASLWPMDLPAPQPALANLVCLPPLTNRHFLPAPGSQAGGGGQALAELRTLGLPETYILYHGPGSISMLRLVMEAWSWAAQALGGELSLVLLGLNEAERLQLKNLLSGSDLAKTVIALEQCPPALLPWIYQRCEVYFHPAPVSPWGDPVRQALACGRPVVAASSPAMEALVGPAAYLAPAGDGRALGAALISVVVETSLGEDLAGKARQRAEAWSTDAFSQKLGEIYRRFALG
jgi:hypothetical protein